MRRLIYIIMLFSISYITLFSKNSNNIKLHEYEVSDSLILDGVFRTTISMMDSMIPQNTKPLYSVRITDTLDNILFAVCYLKKRLLLQHLRYNLYIEIDSAVFAISADSRLISNFFRTVSGGTRKRFRKNTLEPSPVDTPPTWIYSLYKNQLYLMLFIDTSGNYHNPKNLIKKRNDNQ